MRYELVNERYGNEQVEVTIDEMRELLRDVFGDNETELEERSDGIYEVGGELVAEAVSDSQGRTMSEKRTYAILSGEGERGTWQLKTATDIGIKRILTRERSGGDRWARAFYKPDGVGTVGVDVETGEARGDVFVGDRRYWEQ